MRRRRSWRRRAAPRRRPESLSIPAPRIPPPRLSLLAAGRQELVILTHIALLCTPHRDDVGTSRSSVAGCGEWFGCRDRTNARLASVLPYLQLVRAVSVALLSFTYVHSFTTHTVERTQQEHQQVHQRNPQIPASVDGAHKSFSTFRQEPRGARPSPTPREGTSRNARTTSYNRTTDRTHSHTTHGDGGRGRGTRGSAGGGSTAHRRSKWRSPVLPSGHAGPQSLRNATTPLSGLRAPRRGPRRPCLVPPCTKVEPYVDMTVTHSFSDMKVELSLCTYIQKMPNRSYTFLTTPAITLVLSG